LSLTSSIVTRRRGQGVQGVWRVPPSLSLLPPMGKGSKEVRVQMAIKVLIERTVKKGYEEAVWEMLRQLRSEAVRQRGYLYGETWRAVDNPRLYMVLSVWASKEHWDRWVLDEFRQKMEERINRMLVRPSKVRVFEETTGLPVVAS